LPGFSAAISYGLAAPAGTPRAIVDRLNKELVTVLRADDLRARSYGRKLVTA
jgi:tripartite-type tricarboxylate transporter receptor subunit TctC